jgi:hypothetical protein
MSENAVVWENKLRKFNEAFRKHSDSLEELFLPSLERLAAAE